jgi:hypothetical protein
MKKLNFSFLKVFSVVIIVLFTFISCDKDPQPDQHFNLDVTLWGNKSFGYLKFRQNPDAAKIIDLDILVHHLTPNHEYLLQRAVDAINVVDGNCTSTSWLTLGKGLTPQSIKTDNEGNGEEKLWRDVTAIPSGSTFDIHFQVIDAVDQSVALASECYWYKVR